MAGISVPGIGSGLDVDGIVTKLMNIERRPLDVLAQKKAGYQSQLSAYGKLRAALDAFGSAAAALADPARFSAFRATVADASLAKVSVGRGAVAGSVALEVLALAQAHKLRSDAFVATGDVVGSGTLTIEFGTYSGATFTANAARPAKTITIPAGNGSLAGVRDAINAAGAGVTANLVNDGSGYRLVLASAETGAAHAMRISVQDADGNHTDAAGLSRLVFDGATGGTMRLAQSVAAQDASANIDGLLVKRASNVFNDVLEGVSMTLTKAAPGTPTTLTVERDTGTARGAIGDLVNAYNDLEKTMDALGAYDPQAKRAGELLGDGTLRTVQTGLRGLLTRALSTSSGGLASLADAGIRFQRDGSLTIDDAKLGAVLADPAKDVSTLFAAVATATDSSVRFVSATPAAQTGRYAVELAQAATRGAALGSAAAATTITAGANDRLDVAIDGQAVSVTLVAGTYTAAALATEIQSKINTALGTGGPAASVTTDGGGVLTVTSARYGSGSTVALTGGNALAALFGTPTASAGANAVGTIGGIPAASDGQKLTGQGLTIEVSGSAVGARGEVRYATGFAAQIDVFIDRMLAGEGPLASRTSGIQRSIDGLGRDEQNIARRLEMTETRLRAQFTALDAALASMTATSNYLAQQLAAMPKPDSGNR
jgi:flagellar hook-associated protein 2